MELINANPRVFEVVDSFGSDIFTTMKKNLSISDSYSWSISKLLQDELEDSNEMQRDAITTEEIFGHIRHINDPEHPLTLEQLHVVCREHVTVEERDENGLSRVAVLFTPTIPHCSMATLIGLSIRVKLLRSIPKRFKVSVNIFPGSHNSEEAVNRQLNDKERVAAALENAHLLDVVNKCMENSDR